MLYRSSDDEWHTGNKSVGWDRPVYSIDILTRSAKTTEGDDDDELVHTVIIKPEES